MQALAWLLLLGAVVGLVILALRLRAAERTVLASADENDHVRRQVADTSRQIAVLSRYEGILDAEGHTKEWVLCDTEGGPMRQSNLRFRSFVMRKVLKLGLPKIRIHDLRHTAATLLLQQGVHPKVVQEQLGHS